MITDKDRIQSLIQIHACIKKRFESITCLILEKAENSLSEFDYYDELNPKLKKIIFKNLIKNSELDSIKFKRLWKLICVLFSKENVSTILDYSEIELYEISDIHEESDDTLMILDINLLCITELQEKFLVFDLEMKLDYNIVWLSERDQNVWGYIRAQIWVNEQFLTAAADVIWTKWKSAVVCYQDSVRFKELEEMLKDILDKSKKSEDEQLFMRINKAIVRQISNVWSEHQIKTKDTSKISKVMMTLFYEKIELKKLRKRFSSY